MPTLTGAQQVVWRRLVDLGKKGLAPERLAHEILQAIATVVPNEGAHMWTVDPATMLLNRLLATSELDHFNRRVWLRHHYLTELDEIVPYFSSRKMLLANVGAAAILPDQGKSLGLPLASLRQVSADDHQRWFRESQSPASGWGFVSLRADGQIIGLLMTLHRAPERSLTPTQLGFLKQTSSMIGQILQAAIKRERALTVVSENGIPGASGILVVGADQKLTFATPAGEAWVRLMLDAETESGSGLPTPIWSVMAALDKVSATGAGSPVASVLAPTRTGFARLEASQADESGAIAVVIAPQKSPDHPTIPVHWPLTAQERRVAAMVLVGSSNRQISESLHVTIPTVETHLAHIYDKLGIRKRTGLAALLFQSRDSEA